jgi:hypothetical protein
MKSDTGEFLRKVVAQFQFSFRLKNFNDHFTLEHKYYFELISLRLQAFTLVTMLHLVTFVTILCDDVITSHTPRPRKDHCPQTTLTSLAPFA